MKLKQYDEAVGMLKKAVELFDCFGSAHYNLACYYSLKKMLEPAVKSLARAIECGYEDYAHIEKDPDLDFIRESGEYRRLLERKGR